jgi:hypothetical protein
MSLASIRAAIVSGLSGISGLRVYDHVPDSVNVFPAVALRLWAANYTDSTYTFRLLLLASGWDVQAAELSLHPFLEKTGASSIAAVLNADPGCMTALAGPIGRQLVNGVPYLGVEVTVVAVDM